jgi:sterol desaturase/sphingolipid hydroxylase (fatty acid hydroxylase superfamily)
MSTTDQTIAELYARIGDGLVDLALGGAGRLAPVFLLATLLLVFVLWALRRPGSGFLRWAFPREVWFHPSHRVDLKVFLFGRLLTFLSASLTVLTSSSLGAQISAAIGEGTGPSGTEPSAWPPLVVAVLILLTADFCVYWFHRLSHEWPVLWPFHATHHSAEVMTPLTVYRKHPVYDLLSGLFGGAVMGLVMGVVLGITVGAVPVAMLGGINALYYLFNLAGANLRHSHVWLSYGRIVEHIVISPAQHQVHHSIDPRHHDRNYGEVLAIWDWMFGTLYVPEGPEDLRFGLSDAQGNLLPQRHPTLGRFLIEPFRSCAAATARLFGRLGSKG